MKYTIGDVVADKKYTHTLIIVDRYNDMYVCSSPMGMPLSQVLYKEDELTKSTMITIDELNKEQIDEIRNNSR